jgi:transcriptional regulator with XRE-family HTH domain
MPTSFSPARLRERRAAKHLTREQLAVAAGRSASTIALLERGEVDPKSASVGAIAAALGCDVCDLFAPDTDDRPEVTS